MMDNFDEIYLGLDISTSCLGISLFKHDFKNENTDGKLILLEGLNLKTKETNKVKGVEALFIKADLFKSRLLDIIKLVSDVYHRDINKIIIEQPLVGSNNINTVAVLLKFNGMISQIVYKETGIIPDYISSYEARLYSFPELYTIQHYTKKDIKKEKKEILNSIKNKKLVLFGAYPFSIDKKHIIKELIENKFPDIKWVLNKNGSFDKSNYDGTDSLAAILGFINKEKSNNVKPEVIESEVSNIYIKYTTSFLGKKYDFKITT
jgi:hypothetical protein